jgi:hypothetical protein
MFAHRDAELSGPANPGDYAGMGRLRRNAHRNWLYLPRILSIWKKNLIMVEAAARFVRVTIAVGEDRGGRMNDFLIEKLLDRMNILIITPSFPNPGNLTECLFNSQQAQAFKKAGNVFVVMLCKPRAPEYLAKRFRRYAHLACLPQYEKRDGIFIIYNRFFQVPHHAMPTVTSYLCAYSIIKTLKRMRLEHF